MQGDNILFGGRATVGEGAKMAKILELLPPGYVPFPEHTESHRQKLMWMRLVGERTVVMGPYYARNGEVYQGPINVPHRSGFRVPSNFETPPISRTMDELSKRTELKTPIVGAEFRMEDTFQNVYQFILLRTSAEDKQTE